jgi:hypothetical protein
VYEGVDTVVLHNELAYHDVLPVRWEPLAQPLDSFRLGQLEEANVLLLQACVAVEEHPLRDKGEDQHPLANELARLDFKLNLLLQMVGTLVNQAPASEAVPVQFNALGASWQARGTPPRVGSQGMLHIRLRGAMVQTLDLYAEITSSDAGAVSAKFLKLPQAATDLIQQLCFLRHRKEVAGSRKSRNKS